MKPLRPMRPPGVDLPGTFHIDTTSITLTQEMMSYAQNKAKVKGWGGTLWYVQTISWEFDPKHDGGFPRHPLGFHATIILKETT